MRNFLIIALVALLLIPAAASAQVIAGSGSGAALLIKDGKTEAVGQVLAEVGYRFPFNLQQTSFGELVAIYGANVNNGQLGGLLYRHYIDTIPGNGVMPGITGGFFAVGAEDIVGLTQTTIFAGGGALLDITPGTDTDKITGYGEFYKSVSGDAATLIRFGIRAALN